MSEHSAEISDNLVGAGTCPEHHPHITSDGECVCAQCGVVLSDGQDLQGAEHTALSIATQGQNSKSNINLFLAHRLGGHEIKSLPGLSTSRSLEIAHREVSQAGCKGRKKKKNANSFLSRFSNACSKLELTHAESEHAWQIFVRLYDELSESDKRGCVNASEIACYAIAAGSLNTTSGVRAISESVLVNAVRFTFRTKVVRDMYYIRRAVETRTQLGARISVKPSLSLSAKWMRGRY